MRLEIKTTEQIFRCEFDILDGIDSQSEVEDYMDEIGQKIKWVKVEDVINWINKLRKSNDMWRYAVDDCFGMLEDALTSNSESKNSKTNKD